MNEFYTTILALGSFFGALTIILAFLHKYNLLDKLRDWFLQPVNESVKEMNDRLSNLSDQILKITVCSEELPIEERLCAGEIYTNQRNLNGPIKAKYKILKENYENELKKTHKNVR